ncbi:MAG: glycosyltransferase family 39 protein [Anaerolineae bacterium]|nr:glycosyltransferase family 39 protein [Anaerolineae bacterium]
MWSSKSKPASSAAARVLLILILLLATGLRAYRLDAQSFWNDEGNAARAAERRIPLILDAAEGDIHPPGYYLLLHAWRTGVGESEFALRSLSVLASALTVALTYALARRMLGTATGLAAAFLAALSPLAVYYAQEARMYALLGLMSALSTYLALRWLETRGTRHRISAAYALTIAAGLYTQYAFPFVLIAQNLVFLGWWIGNHKGHKEHEGHKETTIPLRRKGVLTRWIAVQLAALALFLPWLPITVDAVTGWPAAGSDVAPWAALLDIFRVLAVGITMELAEAALPLAAMGALLAAGWLGALRAGRRESAAVAALTTWLLLPIALIFAFDLYKPAYLKFLVAVLPPFHILIARGIERLSRLLPPASCLLLLASCSLLLTPSLHALYFDPAYARDNYRQIAADVASMARPGDGIILNAANQWEVFTYYHRDGAPVYPLPRSRPPDRASVYAELEDVAAAHDRLFVLYWGDAESDPERLVETWLAGHAYKAGDTWVGRVRLAVYAVAPLSDRPEVALDARLGQTMHLHGYALGSDALAPGDILPVTLFWETDIAEGQRYKVFLQLLDQSGRLVAQTDGEPGGGLIPTSIWPPGETTVDRYGVLLPPDLPGGTYTLITGMYHLVSGERLTVTVDGAAAGDYVRLGTVAVDD